MEFESKKNLNVNKKKSNKDKWSVKVIVGCLVVLIGVCSWNCMLVKSTMGKYRTGLMDLSEPNNCTQDTKIRAIALYKNQSWPDCSAQNAILIDGNTGQVLYEKNADQKCYPASITKIMTALITLETMEKLRSPLEQSIIVPTEALNSEGSSIYLKIDEKISIKDLLYGMMLRSGNDAANALALIIGGDIKNFAKMMNERAAELGCTSTNFVNPNGLFNEEHYTTARDMAIISMEAMKNSVFHEIAGSKTWQAHRSSDSYCYFYNKNQVVHKYKGGNGIKIGYTKSSGRTLVASAERDGRFLICVVMNAPNWFNDAYQLMDTAYH